MATKGRPGTARPREDRIGDDVCWTEIGPDGDECDAFGVIWHQAEPLAGMAAWWVKPDIGPVVLVCRASRRHRAGRARTREVLGQMRERYVAEAGRFIDKGEWFRETDPRSRFARPHVPPTHVLLPHPDAAAQTDLMLFATLCERAERGEDIDFSVKASDVAVALAAGDERD